MVLQDNHINFLLSTVEKVAVIEWGAPRVHVGLPLGLTPGGVMLRQHKCTLCQRIVAFSSFFQKNAGMKKDLNLPACRHPSMSGSLSIPTQRYHFSVGQTSCKDIENRKKRLGKISSAGSCRNKDEIQFTHLQKKIISCLGFHTKKEKWNK